MNATKQLPDVTSSLLRGFSPYLQNVVFDFPTNSIEFQLLDRVEQPTAYRVLRFDRLSDLQITPPDPEEADPKFIDSIIGAHRDGAEFHFHTTALPFHSPAAPSMNTTATLDPNVAANRSAVAKLGR